ncbi:hypothetical protein DL98DRAFT_520921 [Cadophora sp. DSE1049]|nr:hypothetical protein DL98DRAFT_520921 [Cadophora sp. DSE1049]
MPTLEVIPHNSSHNPFVSEICSVAMISLCRLTSLPSVQQSTSTAHHSTSSKKTQKHISILNKSRPSSASNLPIVRSTVPCMVHRRLNRNAICLFPGPGPSRIPAPSLPSRGSLVPERGNLRGFRFRPNGFRDWGSFTALAASSGTALYERWIE